MKRWFFVLWAACCVSSASADTKQAYFGDVHIHTMFSMDAFMRNVRTTPDDAYRFAKGAAIAHPNGSMIRLGGPPLDFLAVSDHAMVLGVHASFLDPESPNFDHEVKDYVLKPYKTESEFQQRMVELRKLARDHPDIMSPQILRDAWQRTIDAANRHNDPGRFTAFIGYEYTLSPGMRHLHRNVIFRGASAPARPFSSLDSRDPKDLWDWLDKLRDEGIEGIAIPHNMNQSDGLAFTQTDWQGQPMTAEFAAQRLRNEPLVELTQLKGTSETHPSLSPNDEWADFQIVQYYLNRVENKNPISVFKGGYARDALLTGLSVKERLGINPFEFGFIGSSDGHLSGASYDEANLFSKNTNSPQARGSVPPGNARSWQDVFTPREATHGPGGLAGVWAHANTRAELFDAMRRKETFATSGPRILLRVFAGTELNEKMLEASDPAQLASDVGVPMGGTLSYDNTPPSLLLWAQRDPRSSWLDRIQIVKGWLEGETPKEQVYDAVCAGGAQPDAQHRCPSLDDVVDLSDCSVRVDSGDVELKGVWRDPEFDPEQPAFYYARVLETESCRWSTWDAVRAGTPPNPALQLTQQDRAWSSPIWYRP